ncbi:MAG: zinc-binding dehydrogenase [Candidatus Omnitrophica bacterium]|nr:zinc-binding dehydrogenase [Candidatus Omnitrophota bacterium]
MTSGQLAIFTEANRPLRLEEHPTPDLAKGEILARVTLCTLCGSDLHTFQGHRTTPVPTVLGHEILGTVIESSGEVQSFDGKTVGVGDRITWTIAASCGRCFYCERGLPQKCESLLKYGHAPITEDWVFNGGLGEYCHLKPGTSIHHVPVELGDEAACPVNCATATIAAALRRAESVDRRTVLVQGAGMLGVTACAMAQTLGAQKILVADTNPIRLERALEFGATHTLDANMGDEIVHRIRELTHGHGADLALELTGSLDSVRIGLDCLRIGGEAIWVGTTHPTEPVKVFPETVVRRMLAVRGVHNYTPSDLDFALRFLEENHRRFPFSALVEKTFSLSQVNEAFDFAIDSRPFRIGIRP